MTFEKERAWSMLDTKPVILYLTHHDEFIVVWNGIVMPYIFAQCMAAERFGVYISPAMCDALKNTYNRLYYAGAFRTREWDHIVINTSVYHYLIKIMTEHLDKVCQNKTGKEIMSWFDTNNAGIIK